MRILDLKVLRGPNYWSNYWKHLIQLRLDIEEFEDRPSNLIPEFPARLRAAMPSLVSHQCSYHCRSGFFHRVEEGTWAGHIIEHLALELQTLAGMDTGYGRTRRGGSRGVYNVVFNYIEEEAGIYAAHRAVDLLLALASPLPVESVGLAVAANVDRLRKIRAEVQFGPTTAAIIEEALKREIPVMRLNNKSLVQLGYGCRQQRVQASTTSRTNLIASDLASDKQAAKMILSEAGIPVARDVVIESPAELEAAARMIGFPLVVKPLDASQGKGVSINLVTFDACVEAFAIAKEFSERVMIESYLPGRDFRALVIDFKLIAAAERIPAHVVGDGCRTIGQLIAATNNDPVRGNGHQNFLTRIEVDRQTLRLVASRNYTLDTVLQDGECCPLKATANLSTGGTAIDCTDDVHPENRKLFERAARSIGLDVAGIDIIAHDLTRPLTESGGVIVEVNACPGLRMHMAPSQGQPRNVATPIIDMLFPVPASSRIPIVAVTGTNGKTTTARLIAHIIGTTGRTVGLTTTDGIYIGGQMIAPGDNTGPLSARTVLRDPSVEVAVLETARGGILRSGLGFDRCDTAVITNVTADHLGLEDICTLREMARVKSVVAHSAARDGHAVLNADDQHTLRMAPDLDCQVVLFSMRSSNPDVAGHVAKGGTAWVLDDGFVTLVSREERVRLESVKRIPVTFEGKAACMVQNVLAAAAAAYAQGVALDFIRGGLSSFEASFETTPGRFNLIEADGVSVLVDYAHNPSGLSALRDFVFALSHENRIGVIAAPGDRRDMDIKAVGRLAASMFSSIIVKEDEDKRGRASGETASLLIEAVRGVAPGIPVHFISREREAVMHAIQKAAPGELVVILAEKVSSVIDVVKQVAAERSLRRRVV